MALKVWRSGRVADCNPGGRRFAPGPVLLHLILIFCRKADGKLSENCRKTPSRENRKRWKIPLISKYSVRIIKTRQIYCRKIPLISKYSVIIVGTRRINLIYMLEKFSVPLTSESVTSGQADGVFRQLFLQCGVHHTRVEITGKS